MAVPVGQGPKYKWLQTERGRAYMARHNAKHGAAKTARYRERHGEEYKAAHAAEQRVWRATPEGKRAKKNYALRRAYGITIEQFEAMAAEQNGACPICLKPLDMGFNTHVDHCHKTGKIRGLLCNPCNTAIGSLGDREETLSRAIAYLRRA